MLEHQIDIIVAGPARAGKSTVVEVLKSAFAAAGLDNVEVVAGASPANVALVLPAMKQTPIRIIETSYQPATHSLPKKETSLG